MRTANDVRDYLKSINKTAAQWARDHGYSPIEVYRVLDGVTKGCSGNAREIAIKLGMKAAPKIRERQ